MDKIDFVILWVDGSDPAWLKEKNNYSETKVDVTVTSSVSRYRDWDNLQYWFRGVEKFAPWVNNIFFITWGHLPKWLNTNHPKLKIINHIDFVPEKYLPTFNSNTIELNLHRIDQLSEHFVLFNDDVFLIRKTVPEDFFLNGKPVDQFVLNPIVPKPDMPIIPHTIVNNTRIINKYFDKKKIFKKNIFKIYNLKYRSGLIRTFLCSQWNGFPGFLNPHLSQAHLKSTFDVVWEKEFFELDRTCFNKFRQYNDVNHWVMRYWNLCSGNFEPRNSKFGKYFNIPDKELAALDYIENQKGKVICINDTITEFDFQKSVDRFKLAFENILFKKSKFEKMEF